MKGRARSAPLDSVWLIQQLQLCYFRFPAKIKARKGKLSLWASTTPQLLHAHRRQGCTARRGAAACPSASHGWPCSASLTTAWNSPAQRTPGAGHSHREQQSSSCTLSVHFLQSACPCISCTSAVPPSRCSSGEQACR